MEIEKIFCQRFLSVGQKLLFSKYLLAVDCFITIGINIKMVNNVYCLHTSESELGAFTASHSQSNLKNVIGNQTVIYLTHYWERTKKNLNIIWLTHVRIANAKQWIIWAFVMIFYTINIFSIWKFVFIAALNFSLFNHRKIYKRKVNVMEFPKGKISKNQASGCTRKLIL